MGALVDTSEEKFKTQFISTLITDLVDYLARNGDTTVENYWIDRVEEY